MTQNEKSKGKVVIKRCQEMNFTEPNDVAQVQNVTYFTRYDKIQCKKIAHFLI